MYLYDTKKLVWVLISFYNFIGTYGFISLKHEKSKRSFKRTKILGYFYHS